MRTLFLGLVFSSSILLAIAAQHFDEDEYGDNDFDSDLFWIGSNLPSVGRPKFKITEHPDGYSMQIGFTGYYMRVRYTDSDNSLDFNIMGYKGSVKYKLDAYSPDDVDFEGTFEVAGGKKRTWWGQNVDAKIKVKYSKPKTGEYRSRYDPLNIEFIFVNKFKRGENNFIDLPGRYPMKNAEDIEVLIRMTIDPRNWADSTLNFEMNAKGDMYRENFSNDWDRNWFPGSYNLSASLAVIDLVEKSPTQRQPKMTAAIDLEEDITFDEQEQDVEKEVPRSQKLFKKSILIDGMINLTGKGSRLAVVKLTDAESNKTIGRMQVRRPDDENYRLEMFMHGEQFAAVNYFQNIAGVTNITVEDMPDGECTEASVEDYEISNTTSLNNTDYDEASLNYTDVNETFLNYTDTNVTNHNEEENTMDLWDSCKTVNRFLESISGDGVYESLVFNDVFFIGAPPRYRMGQTDGWKNLIFEEKMAQYNDTYEGYIKYGGRSKKIMHCKLDNDGTDTNIEMGTSESYQNWGNDEISTLESGKINIDITKRNGEEDLNMKLKYNDERIFDGWFYLTELIHRYARENVPAMITRQLEGFQETHSETTQYVSNLF